MTKQNYRKYLYSPAWQQLKRKVFDRANKTAERPNRFGTCEECGYQPYKPCLQVHHLTYERVGHERLEDLKLLCPRCHKKMHRN